MKKMLAIAFGVIYLTLISGVQVYQHFCCGKLNEVSFVAETEKSCCAAHQEQCSLKHKCCETREFDFKIEDKHQISTVLQVLSTPLPEAPQVPVYAGYIPANISIGPYIEDYGPPIPTELYALFCSLIVYS